MELSSLTFFVTDSCNFNCSYCYQKKGSKFLNDSTIEKAIDFFAPFLTEEGYLNFTGGEPLLAYELIKKTVLLGQNKDKKHKKQFQYAITTNGSLINQNILEFLNHHKFTLMLSFDGYAQEVLREKKSFDRTVSLLENVLKYPQIDLITNSVFTPQTVGWISKSIQFVMELGVPNIQIAISNTPAWDEPSLAKLKKELTSLKKFCLSYYKKHKKIPLADFSRTTEKGIFKCAAGENRITLTPDGCLWGCYLFADYFKGREGTEEYHKYCFGDLDSFIKNYKKIYSEIILNYEKLCMNNFFTPNRFCFLCKNLEECLVCPIDAAFSSSYIGKIPAWTCEIRQIFMREKELFWKELEN